MQAGRAHQQQVERARLCACDGCGAGPGGGHGQGEAGWGGAPAPGRCLHGACGAPGPHALLRVEPSPPPPGYVCLAPAPALPKRTLNAHWQAETLVGVMSDRALDALIDSEAKFNMSSNWWALTAPPRGRACCPAAAPRGHACCAAWFEGCALGVPTRRARLPPVLPLYCHAVGTLRSLRWRRTRRAGGAGPEGALLGAAWKPAWKAAWGAELSLAAGGWPATVACPHVQAAGASAPSLRRFLPSGCPLTTTTTWRVALQPQPPMDLQHRLHLYLRGQGHHG